MPNKHNSRHYGHRREKDQRTPRVDNRFEVQQEEDGGGGTGQRWMQRSSLNQVPLASNKSSIHHRPNDQKSTVLILTIAKVTVC